MSLKRASRSGLIDTSKNSSLSESAKVFIPDLETTSLRNYKIFTSSTTFTIPDWATKMYYVVIAGGRNAGSGGSGAAGGQVVQGNTTSLGTRSLTITVGGANSNSSLAIGGGSTITASGSGSSTFLSAPFAGWHSGGGGGSTQLGSDWLGRPGGNGSKITGYTRFGPHVQGPTSPNANIGGGGGAGGPGGGSAGSSGVVMIYLSNGA